MRQGARLQIIAQLLYSTDVNFSKKLFSTKIRLSLRGYEYNLSIDKDENGCIFALFTYGVNIALRL